jgi:hypothetical protein
MKYAQLLLRMTAGLGHHSVAPGVYETALRARVSRTDVPAQPAFPEAVRWLLDRQFGDGTWGSSIPYHHDRVVCTLASMLALAQWRESDGALAEYSERIEAAAWGVAPHLRSLHRDPHQTTGFDQVISTLGEEARFRGIALSIPPERFVDRRRDLRPNRSPGSGQYPLATRSLELYETAWVVSQLALVHPTQSLAAEVAPALKRLRQVVTVDPTPGEAADLAVAALAFQVLHWAGERPDPARLLRFESAEHFRATSAPNAPMGSVTAHAHLLDALRSAPAFAGRDRAIRKVVGFLASTSTADHFWQDPRHASPYLPTSQTLAALGPQLTLAREAVHFLLRTQRTDGSWGRFEAGTVEETAYCVQALCRFVAQGGTVRREAITLAARWLERTRERQGAVHPPMWIGTSLYCPTRMVDAAVAAALNLAGGHLR